MNKPIRFAIVAGEKSGDILGASLISALREQYPDAEFLGVGGPRMIAAGFNSLADMERLAVMGFVEPLGRLPELLRIKKALETEFLSNPPTAYIGIDAPDFNLRIECRLRANGIPTVHYVSPSVWAYREKRIHGIKESVDLMLTLFPFETAVYDQHGIAARCVGHPLADEIGFEDAKARQRETLALATDLPVLALLPGSRSGEIKRLGPDLIGAALEARQHIPRLRVLIPAAGPEARAQLQQLLREAGVLSSNGFQIVEDSHMAIAAADLVVLASGTATLETLLLRRPMVVVYRLAALTYWLARKMVKIPYVALPNLLAGKRLVPEYIQQQVQIPVLRDEIVTFFSDPDAQQGILTHFESIHRDLRRNASASAAMAIRDLLDTRATANNEGK